MRFPQSVFITGNMPFAQSELSRCLTAMTGAELRPEGISLHRDRRARPGRGLPRVRDWTSYRYSGRKAPGRRSTAYTPCWSGWGAVSGRGL